MLITRFSHHLSEMYYCDMAEEVTDVKKETVLLVSNTEYFYTINPVEIANSLGVVIATLIEYSISEVNGENYKLHKTKEGNWYDLPDANKTADAATILSLKFAINLKERKNRD